MTFRKLMALLAVLAMLAAACGSDDAGDTATDDAATASDDGGAILALGCGRIRPLVALVHRPSKGMVGGRRRKALRVKFGARHR